MLEINTYTKKVGFFVLFFKVGDTNRRKRELISSLAQDFSIDDVCSYGGLIAV